MAKRKNGVAIYHAVSDAITYTTGAKLHPALISFVAHAAVVHWPEPDVPQASS